MLAKAGLLALAAVAAPDGPPTSLTGEALTAAVLLDGEANYRRVAQYDIDVRLDPSTKQLTGEARISWKNDGRWPVTQLWWHLYLNAFRNEQSTFIRESGGRLRSDERTSDNWGWTEVTEITAVKSVQTGTTTLLHRYDLLPTARFEAPDDGNEHDRTVWRTPLPFSVKAGGTVSIELKWKAQLPKVYARTGYAGNFFMVGQWFPKLGVLEESFRGPQQDYAGEPKWNCHQFHAHSEFFADYGDYRVRITVPREYIIGATGRQVGNAIQADGWTTYEFFQDRVHDFAWTADPRYVVQKFTFNPADIPVEDRAAVAYRLGVQPDQLQLTPVDVTMLLQPEHAEFAARYRDAIEQGLKWLGLWFGRYPYETLTLVDGPPEGRGAMGMEYPTLITGGVRWPSPPELQSPETVTVHEFAHQFWYGLVGSNEFEEAWLDEGLTTFSTGLIMDKVYGPQTFAPRVLGLPLTPWFKHVRWTQRDKAQLGNIVAPDTDAIVQPAWSYRNSRSYGLNSYPRAQLAMYQLGEIIGHDTVLRGLRVYHQRWRYRHPTTNDLRMAMEEVSGRSLIDYFYDAIGSPMALDYAVAELKSSVREVPAGVFYRTWPVPSSTVSVAAATVAAGRTSVYTHRVVTASSAKEQAEAVADDEKVYVTEVVVERKGERIEPVTIEVELEDGPPFRQRWDGVGRWQRIRFEGSSRAVAARLYAQTARPIDARPTDDARTLKTEAPLFVSWGARALYWMQTHLQLVGGLL